MGSAVAPRADIEDRRHLVAAEVDKLLAAVKGTRNAVRDHCLLLLMFRHGLRVSEACGLKLSQVDTESRVLHVARLKQGLSTTQPLRGDELRAIKACLGECTASLWRFSLSLSAPTFPALDVR